LSDESKINIKGGEKDTEKPKKNKAIGIVIASLLVILIAIGIVLIFILLREKEPERTTGNNEIIGGRGIVATEENLESLIEELARPIDDASFVVNMSMTLNFDTWDQSSRSTYIKNDGANLRTVYFDIFLDDENGDIGEMIYSSPYIPVGRELRDFGLSKELPAGEYATTIIFNLVDDDYEKITELVLGIRLNISR